MRPCAMCNRWYDETVPGARGMTCSAACHQLFIEQCVAYFGEHKRIVDGATGIAYKVPTREICERGVRQQDLKNYPLWNENAAV